MQREILFRGFHPCDGPETIVVDGEKVKGKWVEGYYVERDNKSWIYPASNQMISKSLARELRPFHSAKSTQKIMKKEFPVLPSTVGQYTGLTDKFVLTKIFEDDIIDSSSGEKVGNYYENKEILKRKSNFVVERMGTKKWRCSEQKAIKCGCRYAE